MKNYCNSSKLNYLFVVIKGNDCQGLYIYRHMYNTCMHVCIYIKLRIICIKI